MFAELATNTVKTQQREPEQGHRGATIGDRLSAGREAKRSAGSSLSGKVPCTDGGLKAITTNRPSAAYPKRFGRLELYSRGRKIECESTTRP